MCEKICPLIRETVFTGIRKASQRLNYENSIPNTAFLCSSAEHRDTTLHAATISSSDLLTCTTHPGTVFSEMTEEHKIWFGKDTGMYSLYWSFPSSYNIVIYYSVMMMSQHVVKLILDKVYYFVKNTVWPQ